MAPASKWLLRSLPDDGSYAVFCFPYAGAGASSYRGWPGRVAGAAIAPLQPPGRENRFREATHSSHAAFADDLVEYLAPRIADRPYAFAAHCGGVPYALQTILHLEDRGMRLPDFLLASSWGAPHTRLYGRLNFVDLDTHDFVVDVEALFEELGGQPNRALAEIGARLLHEELVVQRRYLYDASRRLPCKVLLVGWSDDDVVTPAEVPGGWDECADTRYVELAGEHLTFLACPPDLQALLAAEIAAVGLAAGAPAAESPVWTRSWQATA